MDRKIPFKVRKGSFSAVDRLTLISRRQRHAVLATESDGQPYTSLVAFALTADRRGIIFATPRKSAKYRNILKNKRVALLIDTRTNTDRAYAEAEAVTVLGNARPVRRGTGRNMLLQEFARRHPLLAEFARAKSSALVLVELLDVLHVTSFQTVSLQKVKKT